MILENIDTPPRESNFLVCNTHPSRNSNLTPYFSLQSFALATPRPAFSTETPPPPFSTDLLGGGMLWILPGTAHSLKGY